MQVLTSRDGSQTWRVERRDDGWWRVFFHGGLVLDRVSIVEAGRYLEAVGAA